MEEHNKPENVSPEMLKQRAKNKVDAAVAEKNDAAESQEHESSEFNSTNHNATVSNARVSYFSKLFRFVEQLLSRTPFRYIGRLIGFVWRTYKDMFFEVAYIESSSGDEQLSVKRSAMFILLTIGVGYVIFYGTIPLLKTVVDAYQAMQTEQQQLFFGQPIYKADEGIYQVTACDDKTCKGGDNALVFDIPDNYFLDIKYTFTKGKGYDPEHEVVSAFNSAYQDCVVTTYGHKPIIFNYVIGQYKWHPKILDKAECSPLLTAPNL